MDAEGIAQVAGELHAIAKLMLIVDGDRDHMNKSDMTCEMVQVIAAHLRTAARELGFREVDPPSGGRSP